MTIKDLLKDPSIEQHKKLNNKFNDFEKLINALKKRDIPSEIVDSINGDIDEINAFSGSHKELLRHLRKTQFNLLKLIEKELKLVTKNHYRNMWMAVGMAAFGIPFWSSFWGKFRKYGIHRNWNSNRNGNWNWCWNSHGQKSYR